MQEPAGCGGEEEGEDNLSNLRPSVGSMPYLFLTFLALPRVGPGHLEFGTTSQCPRGLGWLGAWI
jgi:hypothetical protein